jgi:hypothetical protein
MAATVGVELPVRTEHRLEAYATLALRLIAAGFVELAAGAFQTLLPC